MSKLSDDVLKYLERAHLLAKYRTPDKEVYVGFWSDWGHEVAEVRSTRFQSWLRQWTWRVAGTSLSKADCTKIGQVLESTALHDTHIEERHVYTRVGWHQPGKTLYINLMDDHHRVVKIPAGGEPTIVRQREVPLVFYHGDRARPLPAPQPPANGETLDDILTGILPPGITPQQRVLVTAWLLGALHPTGPYPILALGGEPGSAKSFTCRLLHHIVDPAVPELLSGVMTARDLAVAAKHNYCLAFDNLSKLSKPESDRLCRLATGAGMARRSLYTNDELHALDVKRPVLLNGIGELLTEADVLDRSIQVHLPRLSDDARMAENELWARFEAKLPVLLWFLYRALAVALGQMGTVELPQASRPRMVDFARWVVGAEGALGWEPGTFLAAYEQTRAEAADQAIVASVPVQAVIRWMQERERLRRTTGQAAASVAWNGRAMELDTALRAVVREHGDSTRLAGWPRNANVLKAHLHMAAGPLRRLGLDMGTRTEGKARLHITYITPCGPTAWQTYPTFGGSGLASESASNGDDKGEGEGEVDTSFRAAYAASDPVSAEHRATLRRAGYSDAEVAGLTDRLAALIAQDFLALGRTIRAPQDERLREDLVQGDLDQRQDHGNGQPNVAD